MSVISAQDLTRRFGGRAAVSDISFEIQSGEIVAVLGPNGAGKTTTIELLEGYLSPSAGYVSVLGADPRRGNRAWRARIGLVMQSNGLDVQLTVRETLAAFAAVFPRPISIDELLVLVDLQAAARTRIGQLSGGQKRRVDLAVAVVGRPDVLFLDEPTSGLDPDSRRRVWRVIEEMAIAGTTVLLTTHHMDEAQAHADRLLVLRDGRLVADTTPDGLRASTVCSTVRLPCPPGTLPCRLPPRLAPHFDDERCELFLRTDDVTDTLAQVVDWANTHAIGLSPLEVGPPSLEDAYLELTRSEQERAHA